MSLVLFAETAGFLLCTLLYVLFAESMNVALHFLFMAFTAWFTLQAVYKAKKKNVLIGFVTIANFFILCIFVVRPLYLWTIHDQILSVSNFARHASFNGMVNYVSLPLSKASYIGLVGAYALNCPFIQSKKLYALHIDQQVMEAEETHFTKNQIMVLLLFTLLMVASGLLYFVKKSSSQSIGITDLLFVFLSESMMAYLICHKRKASMSVYAILLASMVLLAMSARRQYIVNLLICFIVPMYYAGKNRKAVFRNIILMGIALFALVYIYGQIRRSMRSGDMSIGFIESILGEFCMYDMLVVSLDYVKKTGTGLFWGYHYLTVFTTMIPGVSIQTFDHFLTEIVFKGTFHGGIPTSLLGSLYFNFSYIGVALGAFLLGKVLLVVSKKLQRISSADGIVKYAIFCTFVYDIIRVGDIGRELWSLITVLLVNVVFTWVMRKVK